MILQQYRKCSNSKDSRSGLIALTSNLVILRSFSKGNDKVCIKSHVRCLKF